jgi:RNA polymerase sigma factor (sigma-70 family)
MTDTETAQPTCFELALVSQIARALARRHRLSAEDQQDFEQHVHLKLLERRYDVFERFEGRSSLRTYLTTVVSRLLLDWQNSRLGKWRPSAAARRLGPHAVAIEQLMDRDGLTPNEAVEVLCDQPEKPSRADLERIREQLPRRVRRRPITLDIVDTEANQAFVDHVEARDNAAQKRRIRGALWRSLDRLPAQDRSLILLHYWGAYSIRSIAERWREEPKTLYRRAQRAIRTLRSTLADYGVTTSLAPMLESRKLERREASASAIAGTSA